MIESGSSGSSGKRIAPRLPNPRLQRTRAALLRLSLPGESVSSGGDRRAPLSRQPLGPALMHWILEQK